MNPREVKVNSQCKDHWSLTVGIKPNLPAPLPCHGIIANLMWFYDEGEGQEGLVWSQQLRISEPALWFYLNNHHHSSCDVYLRYWSQSLFIRHRDWIMFILIQYSYFIDKTWYKISCKSLQLKTHAVFSNRIAIFKCNPTEHLIWERKIEQKTNHES